MKTFRFVITKSQYSFLSDVETAPLYIFREKWTDFLSSLPDFKGYVVRTELGTKDSVRFYIESIIPYVKDGSEFAGSNHLIIEYPNGEDVRLMFKADKNVGLHKPLYRKQFRIYVSVQKDAWYKRILKFLRGN